MPFARCAIAALLCACGVAAKSAPATRALGPADCQSGDSFGSANGAPVCRAPSGMPRLTNIFVIVMENSSLSTVRDSDDAPYLNGLMQSWAWSSNYHGVAHPSLPNYLALASGETQGALCDCQPTGSACDLWSCNPLSGSCGCPKEARHLADDLESAGLTWRAYGEDMGSPCNLTASGNYAPKHVPFLYFQDLQSNPARCSGSVVDFSSFGGDLASGPPSFAFIAPNLIDDMHSPFPASSTNLRHGDGWLAKNVPPILASSAFQQGGLLAIVWDEDDFSGALDPDGPVPLIVLSPLAQQGGYQSVARADHYSLLATIEDGLGLPRLGHAAEATPLVDLFPAR